MFCRLHIVSDETGFFFFPGKSCWNGRHFHYFSSFLSSFDNWREGTNEKENATPDRPSRPARSLHPYCTQTVRPTAQSHAYMRLYSVEAAALTSKIFLFHKDATFHVPFFVLYFRLIFVFFSFTDNKKDSIILIRTQNPRTRSFSLSFTPSVGNNIRHGSFISLCSRAAF
jgi:hypothetical protein